MAANPLAPTQLPPAIVSLARKLEATHLSLEEFTAILVFLKHESLITNCVLAMYAKNPSKDNQKNVTEIKKAFDALHAFLDLIDDGRIIHEKTI